MNKKHKEEIKGALIASGIWTLVLDFIPEVNKIYRNFQGSALIGIALIVAGVFWLE